MEYIRAVERYLDERRARGELTGDSPAVIRVALLNFGEWLDDQRLPIEHVTVRHVEEWLSSLREMRPNTRRGYLTKLKPFLRWCVATDLLRRDPTITLKVPKVPRPQPRCLDAKQVKKLLAATADPRDRVIVLFEVQMGLRAIEVARLRCEDIDWFERLAGIRGKYGQGTITRTVSIPGEAYEALDRYLKDSPRVGPVIRAHGTNKPLTAQHVSKIVARLMNKAGLKTGPADGISGHALRHTFAQDLVDAGIDVRIVQTALGHLSLTTTETYVRRKPPGLRQAMEGRRYA